MKKQIIYIFWYESNITLVYSKQTKEAISFVISVEQTNFLFLINIETLNSSLVLLQKKLIL